MGERDWDGSVISIERIYGVINVLRLYDKQISSFGILLERELENES